jgi:hypothetical protein
MLALLPEPILDLVLEQSCRDVDKLQHCQFISLQLVQYGEEFYSDSF